MPVGKGDKKGKDSKGKKKESKEDKAPAIVSNLDAYVSFCDST